MADSAPRTVAQVQLTEHADYDDAEELQALLQNRTGRFSVVECPDRGGFKLQRTVAVEDDADDTEDSDDGLGELFG